jgi:hypothetical protein
MAVSSPLSSRQTVAALLTLTAVTGLVDAVSYLRLGRVFVANMTGNVVFLGFSADPRSGLSAAASMIAIAGFILGALAGGRAAHALAAARPGRWLATAFTGEAVILGLVAVLTGTSVLSFSGNGRFATIAILAAALGVQNSTVRHLGAPGPDHHRADADPHRGDRGQRAGRRARGEAAPPARLSRRHARRRRGRRRHPPVVPHRGHRDRRRPGSCRRRRLHDRHSGHHPPGDTKTVHGSAAGEQGRPTVTGSPSSGPHRVLVSVHVHGRRMGSCCR